MKIGLGSGMTEYGSSCDMNLGTPSESGSRPVEDRILELEEHCQEQEELMPMSSTMQGQVQKELD